jgi:hypothetical protein
MHREIRKNKRGQRLIHADSEDVENTVIMQVELGSFLGGWAIDQRGWSLDRAMDDPPSSSKLGLPLEIGCLKSRSKEGTRKVHCTGCEGCCVSL